MHIEKIQNKRHRKLGKDCTRVKRCKCFKALKTLGFTTHTLARFLNPQTSNLVKVAKGYIAEGLERWLNS